MCINEHQESMAPETVDLIVKDWERRQSALTMTSAQNKLNYITTEFSYKYSVKLRQLKKKTDK